MTDSVFLLLTFISNKFVLPEFASFYGSLPVSEPPPFVKNLGVSVWRPPSQRFVKIVPHWRNFPRTWSLKEWSTQMSSQMYRVHLPKYLGFCYFPASPTWIEAQETSDSDECPVTLLAPRLPFFYPQKCRCQVQTMRVISYLHSYCCRQRDEPGRRFLDIEHPWLRRI